MTNDIANMTKLPPRQNLQTRISTEAFRRIYDEVKRRKAAGNKKAGPGDVVTDLAIECLPPVEETTSPDKRA